jgi:2-methylfumaryl-CoA isomerase
MWRFCALRPGLSPGAVTDADGVLAGLRVIEISSFVAAPLGGMTLAQLGADVIRVERGGGAPDQARWPRTADGASLYWAGLNKGKRSITIDFRSPRGQKLIAGLITAPGPDRGILLTNAVGRRFLEHETLRRHRPDLIQVVISGYRDGSPAVDYTVIAALGFPWLTGPEELAAPVNHVLPAWDIACGLHAAIGILAAERRRRIGGTGGLVNIALYDVALATVANLGLLGEAQLNHVQRERIGNYLYGGFGRDFRTRDQHTVMVVALTARHWNDLMKVTGLAGTVDQMAGILGADFSTDDDRFRYREVVAGLLRPWFENRDAGEIERQLTGTSVLFSRYRSVTDLVGDGRAELTAHPMMAEVDQPGIGRFLVPGSPLEFAGSNSRPARTAPVLGEHTAEVLSEILGLSDPELAELGRQRVIGEAS